MKTKEIKIGSVYLAKVSNRIVRVKVNDSYTSYNGRTKFNVTNLKTGRKIVVSAARLRREVNEQPA